MTDLPSGQQGYPALYNAYSQGSDTLKMKYMLEQIMGRSNHVALVQVKNVTNKGDVSAVGNVDVQPMVRLMDGEGNGSDHGVVNNLAYFRLQGGTSAVIMDPKAGDIGVAVFADRDISAVKNTKKISNPGSFRRNDMADGLFFPCVLGGKPTSYVQFKDDGTVVVSPDGGTTLLTVQKDKVKMETSSLLVSVTPSKICLGSENALHAVETVDGPSSKVFAVINESK